jgi:hypothetical protein
MVDTADSKPASEKSMGSSPLARNLIKYNKSINLFSVKKRKHIYKNFYKK